MSNRWGIPKEVEEFVKQRDTQCIYCGIIFEIPSQSRKTKPTWEHIINDIRINHLGNIALCCASCNASKGAKELNSWLRSKYCISKGITENNIATVVKNSLANLNNSYSSRL